jgi:hypothetical protein
MRICSAVSGMNDKISVFRVPFQGELYTCVEVRAARLLSVASSGRPLLPRRIRSLPYPAITPRRASTTTPNPARWCRLCRMRRQRLILNALAPSSSAISWWTSHSSRTPTKCTLLPFFSYPSSAISLPAHTAPPHRGPTMGSGKGLLADALLLPALGTTPASMTEATTDEEWGVSFWIRSFSSIVQQILTRQCRTM